MDVRFQEDFTDSVEIFLEHSILCDRWHRGKGREL